MASKNSLDDVFKTMRQYQQNNSGTQTADQPASTEPKVNSTPSTNQIEIPKTAKQSKFQRLLGYLPFMHSPKRNLIYGIGGTVLAIGLVLAAFHAIVSPTAPNSNGDRSTVSVTQSEKQRSDDHRKSAKKTESHQKKSDEKQSKQKKQESKKPEQKKQESKKPEQKKSQPARQQANTNQSRQSHQSNRSTQHQAQPARQQTAQSHRNAQPARQQASQPSRNAQRQSQPANNGGWSVNNGGQSSNNGAGSGSGTMSDGVYDGWDDDSRVGIYDADGNLVN